MARREVLGTITFLMSEGDHGKRKWDWVVWDIENRIGIITRIDGYTFTVKYGRWVRFWAAIMRFTRKGER